MKSLLPQHCPLPFLYLSWVVYFAGFVYLVVRGDVGIAAIWVVAVPVGWWAYVRFFPRVSHLLGYGRVDDVAAETVQPRSVRVTMYSSLGCPFCPIVEARLRTLQQKMGFDLECIDVTLRPDLLRAKGIRAVPVVEVNTERLVGHVTTQDLAALIEAASRADHA